MKRIYLCGFMGCGKTRIGSSLAKALGASFYDLDSYIVEKEGKSIPDIFAQDGEEHFRALEAKYISEMPEGSVTALGGGAIINDRTAETAKRSGAVIFLDLAFETCYDRIKDDPNRPLAYNSPKEEVKQLYDKRRPVYLERSDIVTDAKGSPEMIVLEIINKLGRKEQ